MEKKLKLSLFLSAVLSTSSTMASTDAKVDSQTSEATLTVSQGRCKAGVIADCSILINLGGANNFFTITNTSQIPALGVKAQFPSGDNWSNVVQTPSVANIQPGESQVFSYTVTPPTPTNGSIIPIRGSNTGNSIIYVKFCFGIACP